MLTFQERERALAEHVLAGWSFDVNVERAIFGSRYVYVRACAFLDGIQIFSIPEQMVPSDLENATMTIAIDGVPHPVGDALGFAIVQKVRQYA